MLLLISFSICDKSYKVPSNLSHAQSKAKIPARDDNKLRLKSVSRDIFVPNFKSSLLPQMKLFKNEAMKAGNPKWKTAVSRIDLETDNKSFRRSDFETDRNRIMHSDGYDRLRYKTQVYPVPENDMISTRGSHVNQVVDVSRNIAKRLGLNEELAEAIAQGHDIGHAPFGHAGERALRNLSKRENLEPFWHEKNGLKMIDSLITFQNEKGENKNLNLTYAVRDGIISHCGEVDDNFAKPRNEVIDLYKVQKLAQYQPYTWEGLVVKISDKIAYLGRDIEDAVRLGAYNQKNLEDLKQIVKKVVPDFDGVVNNSFLIDLFSDDIVENSSPNKGIGLSKPVIKIMQDIRKYNTENLYFNDAIRAISEEEAAGIINKIYSTYDSMYQGKNTINFLESLNNPCASSFKSWLERFSDNPSKTAADKNKTVYNLNRRQDYRQAIVDYISGMTDKFALKTAVSL